MMRNLFKVCITLGLFAFVAGGAFAWDLVDDGLMDDGVTLTNQFDGHVTKAPTGKGDLLIYPLYYATDGWETKIQVMNTSTAVSVVARLSVRSFRHSQEIRDFMIYLTPADVWTGTLRQVDGVIRMQSCDDSTLNANFQWGNGNDVCMDVSILAPQCATDSNVAGYVEIMEVWHSFPGWIGTTWGPGNEYTYPTFFPNPIPKQRLYDWVTAGPFFNSGVYPLLTEADVILQINGINNEIPPANVLAGHLELINDTLNVRAPLGATVLEDYNVDTYVNVGTGFPQLGELNSSNSLCEVEAALSKNNISVPYYNMPGVKQTYYWFNFPTKLSQAYNMNCTCPANSALSPFFGFDCDSAPYGRRYFDMTEQSPSDPNPVFSPIPPGETNSFPDEVNLLTTTGIMYEEGWINYTFAQTTQCDAHVDLVNLPDEIQFTGAPVIPATMFFDFYSDDNCPAGCTASYGISFLNAAYSQADVYYDRNDGNGFVLIEHYQYEDN